MSTIYLCIGTMKTGTTSIQSYLKLNEKQLNKQGYCYPDIPTQNKKAHNRNGHFLIFTSQKENLEERKIEEAKARELGKKVLEEKAKEYENIILSEELIWHHARKFPGFWKNLKEYCDAKGFLLKIVVYLRRQDELVESLWNQNIKSEKRWSISFLEYINQGVYKYFPLQYYRKLKNIEKYVKKENMIVRAFEKGQFKDGNLISDFLNCVGLQKTEEFQELLQRKNVRLNDTFLEIRRKINESEVYQEFEDDFLRVPLSRANIKDEEGTSKKRMFDEASQKKFMETYDKTNAKVAREYLGRKDGKLFYETKKKEGYKEPDSQQMLEEYLAFSVDYMCKQQKEIRRLREEQNRIGLRTIPKRAYRKIQRMIGK